MFQHEIERFSHPDLCKPVPQCMSFLHNAHLLIGLTLDRDILTCWHMRQLPYVQNNDNGLQV